MNRTAAEGEGTTTSEQEDGDYDEDNGPSKDRQDHQSLTDEVKHLKKKLSCLLAAGSLTDVVSCIEQCVRSQPESVRTVLTVGVSGLFAEAILNGREDVVGYVAAHFPTEFRQFLESAPGEMPESPFHTACMLYDAKLVSLLIGCGASVHRPDTHRLPPLHVAVSGRRVDVIDVLLEHGASINQEDCYGWTPLCVAMNRPDLIPCLLQRGADVNHRMSSGYTALHLAAQRGSQYLEGYITTANTPVATLFQEVPPWGSRRDEDYVPCPLFLAAANGHDLVVKVLVEHPECPPSCKADALLLLCVGKHLRRDARTDGEFHFNNGSSKQYWRESLYFREDNGLEIPLLPPTKVYGNRTEVRTVEELDAIEHCVVEIVYQSVIAYERCLGYRRHNKELACLLRSAANYFLRDKSTCEQGELLVERTLGLREYLMSVHPSSITIHPDSYLLHKLSALEHWLSVTVGAFNVHQHKIGCYPALVEAFLDLIECAKQLHHTLPKPQDTLVSTAIHHTLLLFYDWHNNLNHCHDADFQRLGERFVSSNLHVNRDTTLLHFMLSHHVMANLSKMGLESFGSFASCVLMWGASGVVNRRDRNGKRPIHCAYEAANSLGILRWETIVSPLVEDGAHMDAVDCKGKCVPFSPGTLVRLSCLAARKIILAGIPYRSLKLPALIKRLINLHNPS